MSRKLLAVAFFLGATVLIAPNPEARATPVGEATATPAATPKPTGAEAAAATAAADPRYTVRKAKLEVVTEACRADPDQCAKDLVVCQRHKNGVKFLAAAYLAFWAILMVFFYLTRRRQRRMSDEIRELNARLSAIMNQRSPVPDIDE